MSKGKARLPTAAMPWRWTAWWANVLRFGKEMAFGGGLAVAAGLSKTLDEMTKAKTLGASLPAIMEKLGHTISDEQANRLRDSQLPENKRCPDEAERSLHLGNPCGAERFLHRRCARLIEKKTAYQGFHK